MPSGDVPVVGIIGGIGSGKTAVAEAVGQLMKAARLDADAAGHQALERPEIQTALRNTFGAAVLDDQGRVVRGWLARRVFGDTPQHHQARRELEAIVHPFIRDRLGCELQQIRQRRTADAILLDAALLLEAGWDRMCDAVVMIDVPDKLRLQRVQSRGWSEDEFRRREASQLSIAEKRKRANVVIDNSGDLESAARTLTNWIQSEFEIPAKPETTSFS
jgi:dephospho-CoA kinase